MEAKSRPLRESGLAPSRASRGSSSLLPPLSYSLCRGARPSTKRPAQIRIGLGWMRYGVRASATAIRPRVWRGAGADDFGQRHAEARAVLVEHDDLAPRHDAAVDDDIHRLADLAIERHDRAAPSLSTLATGIVADPSTIFTETGICMTVSRCAGRCPVRAWLRPPAALRTLASLRGGGADIHLGSSRATCFERFGCRCDST